MADNKDLFDRAEQRIGRIPRGAMSQQERLIADLTVALESSDERLVEASASIDAQICRGNELAEQLAGALAVIAKALSIYEHWNWNDFPTKSDEEQFIQVERILSTSPTEALQVAKADTLRGIADTLSKPRTVWHGDGGVTVMTDEKSWTFLPLVEWLRAEADRIEKETT